MLGYRPGIIGTNTLIDAVAAPGLLEALVPQVEGRISDTLHFLRDVAAELDAEEAAVVGLLAGYLDEARAYRYTHTTFPLCL